MKTQIKYAAVVFLAVLVLSSTLAARDTESKKKKALRITGRVAVVTAKAAGKATWETLKFTGKHVVVPIFKNAVIPIAKATPSLAKSAAKLTGKGIKKGIDVLRKDEPDDADNETRDN
jgi:hypothetical protein